MCPNGPNLNEVKADVISWFSTKIKMLQLRFDLWSQPDKKSPRGAAMMRWRAGKFRWEVSESVRVTGKGGGYQ